MLLSHHSLRSMPSRRGRRQITLTGARHLASKCNSKQWKEAKHDETRHFVSFTRGNEQIDVYYSMGQVETEMDHPIQGPSRLTRKNVDLATLELLFDYPRAHTGKGYHKPGAHELAIRRHLSKLKPQERENELKEILRKTESDIKFRHEKRDILVKIMREIEEELHKKGDAERQSKLEVEIELRRKAELKDFEERGRELTYYFNSKAHGFLDEIDMRNTVCLVTLPINRTVLCTTRTGEFSWSNSGRGILEDVKIALRTRSNKLNRPTAVAIGTRDRYFIQFSKGEPSWYGGKYLDDSIIRHKDVKIVAFGRRSNSYFVLYTDGTYALNNVPEDLVNCLNKEGRHDAKIEFVSLGVEGQYFVRFKDGRYAYGGLTTPEYSKLEDSEDQREIREIAFGYGGIIVRYNQAYESRV